MKKFKEVSKDEIKEINKRNRDLIKKRGEVIHWLTEIESELDDLIIYNFIREDKAGKFFEILIWEDFRFSTKLRLFREIDLPLESKVKQKELANELDKLSRIRNKFAHRFSLVTTNETFLIDQKHKGIPVTEKTFNDFKKRVKIALSLLRGLLLSQKGISMFGDSKLMWGTTAQISDPYEKRAKTKSAHK